MPLKYIWKIYSDYLFFIHHAYDVELLAFVLMNNHFHLLARFPSENIGEAMNYFMRETSKSIGQMSGRINQVYGAPYHKCLVINNHYYLHAYKYVYRNPVQAGLATNAENYQFSTLNGLIGSSKIWIPIEEDLTLFSSFEETLKWLNKHYEQDHYVTVENALKHGTFTLPRNPTSLKHHDLNTILS